MDSDKNLINAGINVNIPTSTFIYLGLAIAVPALLIIVTQFALSRI